MKVKVEVFWLSNNKARNVSKI